MSKRTFTPTSNQVMAAECLMAAMAHEQVIRPIVEQYEQAILRQHQFHIAPKWIGRRGMTDRIILEQQDSFLLSGSDAAIYYDGCDKARDAAGLKVSRPGNCPLLEAKHVRIDAENLLLKTMAESPGLEHLAHANSSTLELRAEAVALSLRLLVPFVHDANSILKRIHAA